MQEHKRKKLWEFSAEALAWAVIGAFFILLVQARQIDEWYWSSNNKFGILVLFGLMGVAAAYLRGILFSQERRFKSIEAESFVVKRDGIVLAKLGADEHSPIPSLELFNKWESLAARFGWERESHEIVLSIYDWSGKERSRLSCPSFVIRDSDARQRLQLTENALALRDANGNDLLSISLDESDPQVALSGGQGGHHRIRIVVEDDLPSISLLDSDQKERVVLDLMEELNLRIHDPKGKVVWSAP